MDNGFIKQVKDNWVILFFIASLIATWTRFEISLGTLEARVNESESKISAGEAAQTDIKVQLSQIQTDILWIRRALETNDKKD